MLPLCIAESMSGMCAATMYSYESMSGMCAATMYSYESMSGMCAATMYSYEWHVCCHYVWL